MVSISQLKRYCSGDITKIENYEEAINDPNVKWDCHHRLEEQGYSFKDLIDQGLYYKVSPGDLILLTQIEHRQLHHTGGKRPEETKRKISKTLTGGKRTEESRRKMSNSHKSTSKVYCKELDKVFNSRAECNRYIRKEYNDKWFQSEKILQRSDNCYPKLNLHFYEI